MVKLTCSKVETKELTSLDVVIKLINDQKISGYEAYLLMKDIICRDKYKSIEYVYPEHYSSDSKTNSEYDTSKCSVDIF